MTPTTAVSAPGTPPSAGLDRPKKERVAYAVAGTLLAGLVLASLGAGAMAVPVADVVRALTGGEVDPATSAVVVDIRLPRTILAMLVGAALAVAGGVLQGLFRNPLADPALIGISNGASLAVALAIVSASALALSVDAALLVRPAAAFTGGAAATLFVATIARTPDGTSVATLLLAGVAVNALTAASIGLLLFVADDAELRDINFWMLGSLAAATPRSVMFVGPVIVVALLGLLSLARRLDALVLGHDVARHIGVDVERTKTMAIALSAGAVGASVALCGAIGFVGLVVPHLWRLLVGPGHRALLRGCALVGAALLLGADLVARLALAPAELPVGVVTALCGAPFFLALLVRSRSSAEAAW